MDKFNFFVQHLGVGVQWKLRTPMATLTTIEHEELNASDAVADEVNSNTVPISSISSIQFASSLAAKKSVIVFRKIVGSDEIADQLYQQMMHYFKSENHFGFKEITYSNDVDFAEEIRNINHAQFQGLMVFGHVEMEQSQLGRVEVQNSKIDGVFKELPFIECPDLPAILAQPILKKTVWDKYHQLKKHLH